MGSGSPPSLKAWPCSWFSAFTQVSLQPKMLPLTESKLLFEKKFLLPHASLFLGLVPSRVGNKLKSTDCFLYTYMYVSICMYTLYTYIVFYH